jgi:hypothetical protein
MPRLARNRVVQQATPTLVVENRLRAGRHRFALVVVDDAGRTSAPDVLLIAVTTAPLRHKP